MEGLMEGQIIARRREVNNGEMGDVIREREREGEDRDEEEMKRMKR